MIKNATIDPSQQYRYSLTRGWDTEKPKVVFIMLNGSTADAANDDPTLRRCISFAKDWGYGSLEVVNLFGYRTTLPSELKRAEYPVGPENDKYIVAAIKKAQTVVVAWGTHGIYLKRNYKVIQLLAEHNVRPLCLGKTKDGHPKHPLYIKANTLPVPLWA
jgi:hypothetical protein